MPFGHVTVTLVLRTKGSTPGELGTYPLVDTPVNLPGCRHRPLTFKEKVEAAFDVATEVWRTTIPIGEYSAALRAQIASSTPIAKIRVGGIEYDIIGGIQIFDDFTGPFKATLHSKRHIG